MSNQHFDESLRLDKIRRAIEKERDRHDAFILKHIDQLSEIDRKAFLCYAAPPW